MAVTMSLIISCLPDINCHLVSLELVCCDDGACENGGRSRGTIHGLLVIPIHIDMVTSDKVPVTAPSPISPADIATLTWLQFWLSF